MEREHRYSSCDYLGAIALTAALMTAVPLFWAPPLWILAMLRQE
jgi:hypothetical protein